MAWRISQSGVSLLADTYIPRIILAQSVVFKPLSLIAPLYIRFASKPHQVEVKASKRIKKLAGRVNS